MKEHKYSLDIVWTGNTGKGTSNYRSYERDFKVQIENKIPMKLSADPAFRGNASKYNPEELFLISISSCHMLWLLHLCSENGVVISEYMDTPQGTMIINEDGSGKFIEVILNIRIKLDSDHSIGLLNELNKKANKMCFIANTLNIPVKHNLVLI